MYSYIFDLISILWNKSKSVVHYELRTKSMINLYLLIMTNGRIYFHFISHEYNIHIFGGLQNYFKYFKHSLVQRIYSIQFRYEVFSIDRKLFP